MTTPVRVTVRRLRPEAVLPSYAHAGDAGADLYAAQAATLAPGARALIGTGIAVAIPTGWVGLVHPRSGLAARHGVTIVNAPGTVDAGYRGELMVNLVNLDGADSFVVNVGDRIGQLILQEVGEATFDVADSLPASERGEDGHGSTGGFGPSDPDEGRA